MQLSIKILSLLWFLVCIKGQATVSVNESSRDINTLATYTFDITFGDASARTPLTLNFPSQLTISSNASVSVNSVLLNASDFAINAGPSITINQTFTNKVVVVVDNILNPPSAIGTSDFSISTNNSNDSGLNIQNYVSYISGSLQSCLFSFSGTTEQTGCTLTSTVVLSDPIPQDGKVVVEFPNSWGH